MSPAGDSWGSEATPQTATALDRPETLLHLSFEPLKPVAVVLPPEESHGFFAQRTLATTQSRGNRILLILARTTISSHFACTRDPALYTLADWAVGAEVPEMSEQRLTYDPSDFSVPSTPEFLDNSSLRFALGSGRDGDGDGAGVPNGRRSDFRSWSWMAMLTSSACSR